MQHGLCLDTKHFFAVHPVPYYFGTTVLLHTIVLHDNIHAFLLNTKML